MRDKQLRILLGDGWREPGLRRYGPGGGGDNAVMKVLALCCSPFLKIYSAPLRLCGKLCLWFLVFAAVALPSASQSPSRLPRLNVRAENTLPVARTDETISLAWTTVSAALRGAKAEAEAASVRPPRRAPRRRCVGERPHRLPDLR